MLPLTAIDQVEANLCPIRNVLSQVTGKWQILILFALEDGALRFGMIKKTIGDISQSVLTANLRGLEREGYLTRTVFDGPPVAVSYELTAIGDELVKQLKPVIFWANDALPKIKENRERHDRSSNR